MALPPEIIRLVNACLVRDESPGNRTLQLMAFCGVCQRWREFGREVREPIALDSSTDTQHGPKSTLARFRRSPVAYKRDLFHAASRLLTGYSELSLSGEAINDQMLLNIAVANGPALTSIRLQGTPHVTDAGLCTLISAAPNLRSFSIEEAGPGVVGHFVPALLQHCKQLETLLIEGAEGMDWAVLRLSGAWAAAARAASPSPTAAAAAAGSSSQQQQPGDDSSAQQGPSQQAAAQERRQRPVSAPTAARRAQAAPAQQDPVQDSLSPQPSTTAAAGPSSNSADRSSSRQQPGPSSSMGPLPLQAGGSRSSNVAQQQQGLPLAPRLSSGSSCGNSEYSSCQEEGAVSDDASSSSAGSSIDAGSDSTSISMPAQAVEELAQQLRHILSGGDDQPAAAAAAAAAAGAGGDAPAAAAAAAGPSSSQQAAQQEPDGGSSGSPQQQQRRRRGASKPLHPALRKLRVRLANIDTLQQLLLCVPGLTELQLDGPALSVQAAAVLCPGLRRLSYLVCSPGELDAALLCLGSMRNLRALELEVKGMVLSTEQLRVIGLLPLRELCLDSHAYRQHPSMPRPQYSHLDNDGVKGLVDSICSRMRTELMPLKLSLCGATALKQEAVSALLRLPILASIDTGGCVKLTPMDRMRLVAKVKAGQGLMDKTAAAGAGGAAAGGLRLPHVML